MGHKTDIRFQGMKHIGPRDDELYLVIKTDRKICCYDHLKEMAIAILSDTLFVDTDEMVAFMAGKPVEQVKQVINEELLSKLH